MAKPQFRWNIKLKKSNSYLGTVYLEEPLPEVEDVIMIGDKKYSLVEIQPGSTRDSHDVFVEEVKKDALKK
ncbi:hypothetical protein [Paenibacillus mucilaginosus]|uniref:Uncharacterized protein n=3 Tax=Paenibacillus mucilaginosus TaxID=61624 RepID=H6NAA8_9BACL|nr:hypothetical protein [Paenibacillus mucilaginosus]AEI40748.1 hypothetical protein KNP414_02187 [Paenibacillus mucilaginosus KNP414]AFC29354.1 hypothetical protein PM3016_2466 [Paenibacillus mucilaginosus 3016]AFH61534.1 hypothetical protein B2K_12510 [Paenibacillus mucilaginosus K02]MCG7211772.1 hypothetical protein [Paenibacillus mucilaginosus]WDM29876.1 hypothetical protein KCX80_12325 [Paenibacillus mucilaginosus]